MKVVTRQDLEELLDYTDTRLDSIKVVAFGGLELTLKLLRKVKQLERELDEVKKQLREVLSSSEKSS